MITLATPLELPPAVNGIRELPYHLNGSVADTSLAGFTINGRVVGLSPGVDSGSYDFDVSVELPVGEDKTLIFEAWDHAGNRSTQEYIVHADAVVGIEIVSPTEGAEISATGANALINVAARLTALPADATVSVKADTGALQPMVVDGDAATAALLVPATDGKHAITVQVHDNANSLLAGRTVSINFSVPRSAKIAHFLITIYYWSVNIVY